MAISGHITAAWLGDEGGGESLDSICAIESSFFYLHWADLYDVISCILDLEAPTLAYLG